MNTVTAEYQVIKWTAPRFGVPKIYSIHIVPETVYEISTKSYQRTILHYPGTKNYSAITRRKLEFGISYYVIIYANNGKEETPSDLRFITLSAESKETITVTPDVL